MGRDILGFRTELVLARGSTGSGEKRASVDFLLNHLDGFVRSWVKPEEGDVDRGKRTLAGEEGVEDGYIEASCGLRVLKEGAPRR